MTPRATYRVQFRNGFGFDDAVAIVPYLKRLGVSHLYASPIFAAVSGSTHGYDVTDHNAFDPALGGRAGFSRLSVALKEAGLGLILDIVPNHMAASLENRWWRSIVEWGADSVYAGHFDIDWRERLTLPLLGESFEDALANGELVLRLDRGNGGIALAYFDNLLPLHPSTYAMALESCTHSIALRVAGYAAGAAPASDKSFHDSIRNVIAEGSLAALDSELASTSLNPDLIAKIHAAQPWQLTFWKDARRHLTYRRFFEVTGLVGVRVEKPDVFRDVHRTILHLVRSGQVDGLRIDHVDGLADPGGYLRQLRGEIGPHVLLYVEKILGPGEGLPVDWPVDGTTGYEFISAISELFTDAEKSTVLDAAYANCIGRTINHGTETRLAKRTMLRENFAAELERLVRIATAGSALSQTAVQQAIVELIVAFPIYRTYGDANGLSVADREVIDSCATRALASDEAPQRDALAHITRLLDGEASGAPDFRVRFQQLTGPIMAKALEDTVFYRDNRLLAVNEVGGEPAAPVGGVSSFHRRMADAARRHPWGILATATHDTKRGEDARARLYAISEAPASWAQAVERWRRLNRETVVDLAGGPAPEPEVEWMLFQALAGAWPIEGTGTGWLPAFEKRFLAYVEKALREAKHRTGWTSIDPAYEDVVKSYASRLLSADNAAFRDDFARTLLPIVKAGTLNSLSQTLLKLTAPGIPDIYTGTEHEDFSLVDPDNRRPVDFGRLAAMLSGNVVIPQMHGATLGQAKHALIARCLAARIANPELYAGAHYQPLEIVGPRRKHLVAFIRVLGSEAAVVVAPRLLLVEADAPDLAFWQGTEIRLPAPAAQRSLRNVLDDRQFDFGALLRVSDLGNAPPLALLVTD